MYERKTALGSQGEAAAITWLKKNGFFVLPSALIDSGGAPQLEGWLKSAVLPDTMAAKDGKSRWVEVKTKSRATFHQRTRKWEHGLLYQHWISYQKVQTETGIPGFLCVVECESSLFLLAAFDKLNRFGRLYDGPNMPGGKPHIFFPRDAFDWYQDGGAGIRLITPMEPDAPRTKEQGKAPIDKQLVLL